MGGNTTRLNNNIVLGADTTISSGTTSGATLILGGAPPGYTKGISAPDTNTLALGANKLTFTGAAGTTTQVDTDIKDTGGVDVNTAGTVHYNANKNTYTGTTHVLDGTLIVDTADNNFAPHTVGKTSFWGINGPLVIGDATGNLSSAVVQLGVASAHTNDAINSTAALTINSDGYLNLNGNAQNIGQLTMNGGTINGSTGGLYLDYANTAVLVNATANATATINGILSLTYLKDAATEGTNPDQNRTFDVSHDSTNTSDLTINATIGNGALTKTGNGTMTLATANNNYTGNTTVSDGILNVQVGTENVSGAHRSSLGMGDSDGSSGADTIVGSGGTLQLEGTIAITHEHLVLNGTGFDPGTGALGALNNKSGNNTWGGAGTGTIALGSNATITSSSTAAGDRLTLASTLSSVSGTGYGLTIDGAGNTTISGSINTGNTGSLTKTGTGILTLSGSNGYKGATTISNGIVIAQNDSALGTLDAGTSVAASAELQLTGGRAIGAEALALNGFGFDASGNNTGTTGALRNTSGDNSFGGLVTLGSDSRINSDSGNLTLSGGASATTQSLTLGGSGNTTISGSVNLGTGSLTKDGSGTATLSGTTTAIGNLTTNAGTLAISSGTTTTSAVTINAGTTTFSGNATTTAAVTVNAGTLNFNGTNATTGQVSLLGGATSTIAVGAGATLTTQEFASSANTILSIASGGTVVANYNSGNTVFSGQITGAGAFKAIGTGQVTFNTTIVDTGLTAYIGGTSIGTMANPLTFTITGATTLQFGTLHITGDTILDFGNSSASVLNSASLIIDAGVKVSVINWVGLTDAWYATSSFTQQSGPAAVLDARNAAPENQITFTGFTAANTSWVTTQGGQYNDHEIRPVPEPSTYGAVFLSACLALLGLRRSRRARPVRA